MSSGRFDFTRGAHPAAAAAVRIGALDPGRALLEWLWPPRRAAPGDTVRDLIVVGTDGSEHAAAAVEAAGALAAVWEAAVDVVGVHRFLQPEHPEVTPAVRAAAQTLRAGGLSVRAHVRRGDAALVIAGVAGVAAANARLIVVGAGSAASSPAGSSGRRRPGRRARDLQCADRPPARAGLSATPSTVSSRGRPSAERWRTGAISRSGATSRIRACFPASRR